MWWDATSDQGSPTASLWPPARVPSEEVNVLQVFQGRRHTRAAAHPDYTTTALTPLCDTSNATHTSCSLP